MEKIEGVNLEQWMEFRNYQRLSEAKALNWLKQLVEILALVHAHQYFHRDIKPQNIMLRPSGQLVLIDFGAVRQVTTTILAGNSHTRIISQGYSPPEQQNGYSVQQSDFFALGRTFIFLLTGKEPQDKEIYDPLTNELHWRKSALNLSPLLANLIDHLMAPTENQRPQNTQVILQKLNEIEKALQVPRILWPQTAIQSSNGSKFAASSSSVATVSVGGVKSVNASSNQTQKSQKRWQVLIGLGLGCFAVVMAGLNQRNNKNIVVPEEKLPYVSPSISNSLPIISISQPTSKAKKTLRIKPPKAIVGNSNKRQLPLKGQVANKQIENTVPSNNNVIDVTKTWGLTYPLPNTPDKLEDVIRERSQ